MPEVLHSVENNEERKRKFRRIGWDTGKTHIKNFYKYLRLKTEFRDEKCSQLRPLVRIFFVVPNYIAQKNYSIQDSKEIAF